MPGLEVIGFPVSEEVAKQAVIGTWVKHRDITGVFVKFDDGRTVIAYRGIAPVAKAKGVVVFAGQLVLVNPQDLGAGCFPINSVVAQTANSMRKVGVALQDAKDNDERVMVDIMGYDPQIMQVSMIRPGGPKIKL